jgi:hypothetical protein
VVRSREEEKEGEEDEFKVTLSFVVKRRRDQKNLLED